MEPTRLFVPVFLAGLAAGMLAVAISDRQPESLRAVAGAVLLCVAAGGLTFLWRSKPAYHFNTDIENLKKLLTEFVCMATGGPCKYTGRDMATAHAGMDLVDAARTGRSQLLLFGRYLPIGLLIGGLAAIVAGLMIVRRAEAPGRHAAPETPAPEASAVPQG